MIRISTGMLAITAAAVISMASMAVNAAGEMKPFILGSTGTGDAVDKVAEVKKSLTNSGFEVVGEYSPYKSSYIIIITNAALKKAAASHERAGYIAGQRVAITQVGGQLQVSYTNPVYMAAAYHVKGNLQSVSKALAAALGAVKEYGPENGLNAEDLEGYHYTFGMEYFDEPYELAEYDSYEQAIAAVEEGLAVKAGGATRVYRIDIPGSKQTVFGVGLRSGNEENKFMDDAFIMAEIDFKPIRSTAHLPYEILVTGDEIEALHARFRIAINFPDLSMMGDNSFMNIMPSPDAIEAALAKAVGGTVSE